MVEELILEIEGLPEEEYKRCFPILREKAQKALAILPDNIKYLREKQALESIVWMIDEISNARGGQFESWLRCTFQSKKQYALEALNICLRKEKSPYLYSY